MLLPAPKKTTFGESRKDKAMDKALALTATAEVHFKLAESS